MGLRRIRLGPLDLLVSYPDAVARRIRGFAGLLGRSTARAADATPPPLPAAQADGDAVLQRRVDAIEWYHTIDLGGVVTPGWFDLRPLLHHYHLPQRLEGMRVLDVATFDGFWAFEFERRGAAEVVALDIDCFGQVDISPRLRRQMSPDYLSRKTGDGFSLCHAALRSKVRREILNVYDLSPQRLGTFDLVFMSDLLLHLMNPMQALNNLCRVTAGRAIIAEVYDPRLPGSLMKYESGEIHNTWWSIGFDALRQMILDAGFSRVELLSKFRTGYRGQASVLCHAAFEATP